MYIEKIEVKNFRLLKDFSLDMERELSLIIGRNNTGKTSILTVLEKFLNSSEKNKFSFHDFNLDYRRKLINLIESTNEVQTPEGDLVSDEKNGIALHLYIRYDENSNLTNISKLMMDLDEKNRYILLSFEYALRDEQIHDLRNDYINQSADKCISASQFLENNYKKYFKIYRKSIYIDSEKKCNFKDFIDLDKEKISLKDVINFKYISARREVANKDINKVLSMQMARIYEKSSLNPDTINLINQFHEELSATDDKLSKTYTNIFQNILDKIKQFGGMSQEESIIEIKSSLQEVELLKSNTKVTYKHDEYNSLPEMYNGLGYMNLISIILEIELLMHDFKRGQDDSPADINLLYIEEPEAHTHPQMQYIFIKNIKELLKISLRDSDNEKRQAQCMISTHSPQIVADSDFHDIKYLHRKQSNSVEAKNLKLLEQSYKTDIEEYQFLKQYLTINKAEAFFADKLILIEGDTERILIPAMMKKLDIETNTSLLSQNISILEVGAYSHIFEHFIDFLGIKTLIITDIDTIKCGEASSVACADSYSNASIKHYLSNRDLSKLIELDCNDKILSKNDKSWCKSENGILRIAFQTEENDYHARSFEDSFIHLNLNFILENEKRFVSIKKQNFKNHSKDDSKDKAYTIANNCIGKKSHFAMDILRLSDHTFSKWDIPSYIKEGLDWLNE